VAAVAIPFATLTFNVASEGPLIAWDGRIADRLNAWVHDRPLALTVLEAVSAMGRPPVLALVVVAAALWCASSGRVRLAVFLVATSASGAVLGTVVKLLVARPRPVVDHPVATAFGKSFPSGHAMHATIAYGALALVVLPLVAPAARRRLVALALLVILAIGSSRLLLGVHFLTDVVGGYILGAAWLAAGAAAFETWRQEVPASDREDDRLGSSAPEPVTTYGRVGEGGRRPLRR
jgi:undecaprenyl-diphosphatase